jgi:hypothetical protein
MAARTRVKSALSFDPYADFNAPMSTAYSIVE